MTRPPYQARGSVRAASVEEARRSTRDKTLLAPLHELATDFRDRMRTGLRARGHGGLQPAYARVIMHLGSSGTRLTELAEHAGVSKQAMGKLVAELEAIGYVECTQDPADGRAKIVRFSRKGFDLLHDSSEIVDEIWDYYAELIGQKRLAGLRGSLKVLLTKIDGDRPSR